MITVFDWETSDKADFVLPPEHPSQPYPVQLAALACDEESGRIVRAFSAIVRPEVGVRGFPVANWKIAADAVKVHGITTEKAYEWGLPLGAVVEAFEELASGSRWLVSFNIEFDMLILRRARHLIGRTDEMRHATYCLMRAMTPVCRIPNPYRGRGYDQFKWPSLKEAYQHAFGKELDDAHDALGDTRTAAQILFWLRKKQREEKAKNETTTERAQSDAPQAT